jgi:hypothetical protein
MVLDGPNTEITGSDPSEGKDVCILFHHQLSTINYPVWGRGFRLA